MLHDRTVTLTKQTKIELARVALSVAELESLLPICEYGLPDELPLDMKEALQVLVSRAINPLRARFL